MSKALKFLEGQGFQLELDNTENLKVMFGQSNDTLPVDFAKSLKFDHPEINPYMPTKQLKEELLKVAGKMTPKAFKNALVEMVEMEMDFDEEDDDEDTDGDDDEKEADETRKKFEECSETEELVEFLSEEVEVSAIRDVIRYLNHEYECKFKVFPSDEDELLEQLSQSFELEFNELHEAIDESVDLD